MTSLRARTVIARRLRREATDAERRLWRALREAFPETRLRRQHPIGRHIADIACPAASLAIEIDGGQHAERGAADRLRSAEISRHGYRVIRFWNSDVLTNLSGVLSTIEQELAAAPAVPSPPAGAEREGPAPQAREGEVGPRRRSGIPHLTPTLSAPRGGEGDRC